MIIVHSDETFLAVFNTMLCALLTEWNERFLLNSNFKTPSQLVCPTTTNVIIQIT